MSQEHFSLEEAGVPTATGIFVDLAATPSVEFVPGLKFQRTLWVCNVSGGPFEFTATKPGSTPLGLEAAHREFRIFPAEFDEVAAKLVRTLDVFNVPQREKDEVLAAFAAHKMR